MSGTNDASDGNTPFDIEEDKKPEKSIEGSDDQSPSDIENVFDWLERIKQMSESFTKKEWQDVQDAMRELRTWFGEHYKKKFATGS